MLLKDVRLDGLPTPCLVIERGRLIANIERMQRHMDALGVRLRPHMKTCKSAAIARLLAEGPVAPLTVSTLKEAEYFHAHGFADLMYAVGIVPAKLDRVARLYRLGATVHLVLDSLEVARAVVEFADREAVTLSVYIEIDTDGHRAGLVPDAPELPVIARLLDDSDGIALRGVMTHAGESYNCRTEPELVAHAEQERARCVRAADVLRAAGIACPEVSVGSTPTATFAQSLEGVTECRPGVFVFNDLFQAGIGVCGTDDIALSVLTTVTGHKKDCNWLLIDAGGMALSKDRSTSSLSTDHAYGLVCEAGTGRVIPGHHVVGANQEHGLVTCDSGALDFDRFPIGSLLRVLPNHACMTAGAHDRYHVVSGDDRVLEEWGRCNGW